MGFAGSGAVGRYWQTRCLGFEVRSARGRRLGKVEALEVDRQTRAIVAVVVARRRRKPLRVRSQSVSTVDPWRQALVVELPRRRRRSVRVDAPRVARTLARTAPRVLLVAAFALWLYAQLVFALVRLVVWLLVALTVGTARGGARLKPHLHGAE